MSDDVARRVRQWLADVSANAHPVAHDGVPCGERVPAPCGNADFGPLLPAELLRNGDKVCHRCGGRFRPGEQPYCGRGDL
jgi:hypothetical protein